MRSVALQVMEISEALEGLAANETVLLEASDDQLV